MCRAERPSYGRRSLPPAAGVGIAVVAGNHGVSDPGARARSGPALVPRGRSRHACLCRCSYAGQHVGWAKSAACLLCRARSISARIVRTIRSYFSRRMSLGNQPYPRAVAVLFLADKRRLKRASEWCQLPLLAHGTYAESGWTQRPSRRRCCICARHRPRRCASLRPRVRAAFGP